MSELEAVARELDHRAMQVESAAAQLVRDATQALWTSIAADAFRASVDTRSHECEHVGATLRRAARVVTRYSDDVAVEKARLRRLELDAEHLAGRVAGDVTQIAHALISRARW